MALANAIKAVPKIRGPIQLAGFVFTVFAAALIYHVDPNNTGAITVVGAIGVALITVPLAFHANVLKYIPEHQRVVFLLVLISVLLFSFGALARVTINSLTLRAHGARFDSELKQKGVRLVSTHPRIRLEITWQLFPLSARESVTIFLGHVVLHDEDEIREAGFGRTTPRSCEKVSSCLGNYVFRDLSSSPVFIRAGSRGSPLTAVVDIKRMPKNLRIWWEFYQVEGEGDQRCGVDINQAPPPDGIPYLAMFNASNQKIAPSCYRSFGQSTISSEELTIKHL
jgi:hypothetical protein